MDYLQPHNFISMDPVIKARWLADLRRGDIPQAQGKLAFQDGRRCCLGVLSDIAAEAKVVIRTLMDQHTDYFGYTPLGSEEYPCTVGLSVSICEWAKIKGASGISAQGRLPFQDQERRDVFLDDLNDAGFTFNQIADLIECFY